MGTKTTSTELLKLERQFWGALKERDVDTAVNLTDFPCVVTGPQGIGSIGKKEFSTMMQDQSFSIDRFELDDNAQVRMLSDDVAVLAYKIHEELTVGGKPLTLDAADSSTWIRRDGRWLCALHSEAILGDPFGRDRSHGS
jgi:limonene-1,2-epoxide hydrolase